MLPQCTIAGLLRTGGGSKQVTQPTVAIETESQLDEKVMRLFI
jgi:hypothetical protein